MKYGARPLEAGHPEPRIEDPLADEILAGRVKQGDEVVVTMRKGMAHLQVHTS